MTRPEHLDATRGEFETLRRIFQALDYDLGVLHKKLASRMRAKGVALPRGWMSPHSKIHTKVFQLGERRIGFLVFPPRPEDNATFPRIRELARKMGPDLSLLIGLSPWGAKREKDFLRKLPHAVDILLGGGSGPPFKAKYPNAGKTLWVRPYPEGKTIHSISLSGPNAHEQDPRDTAENLNIRLILLDESIPRNPSIKEIMR